MLLRREGVRLLSRSVRLPKHEARLLSLGRTIPTTRLTNRTQADELKVLGMGLLAATAAFSAVCTCASEEALDKRSDGEISRHQVRALCDSMQHHFVNKLQEIRLPNGVR